MRLARGGAYTYAIWRSKSVNRTPPIFQTAVSMMRDHQNRLKSTLAHSGGKVICSPVYHIEALLALHNIFFFSGFISSCRFGTAVESSPPNDLIQEVLVTTQNRICTITFNRPHKRNAVNLTMARRFIRALQEADHSNDVTLIALTGAGSYFSSGIDLVGFAGPKPGTADAAPAQAPFKFSDLFSTVNTVKKPLIACINGPAVGFAVTMLGLFDGVYASDAATFQTHFTRFGLPPEFASTYTFPRMMGYSRANRILLFCQKASAQEAYDAGLVSCVFPSSTFRLEVERKLKEMATLPLKSLIYTKDLVRGRELLLRNEASEQEQSYFDPSVARDVKKSYVSQRS